MTHRISGPNAHIPAVGPVVPWLLPYLAIWAGAAASLAAIEGQDSCTAFCAIYAGMETYALLLGATVLSALVALAELLLTRPR